LKVKVENEVRQQVENEFKYKLNDTERNVQEYKKGFEEVNESNLELKKNLREK